MQQKLSADAAANICRHMNDDHADAVAAYARAYGNVANVAAATMVGLDVHEMRLAVDTGEGHIVTRIAFDHVLQDTDDARMTLIAMAQNAANPAP